MIASGGGIGNPPAPFPDTTALTAHNPANTLSATLQAFERYGVTRILAEPTVSAVSGESAEDDRWRRNTNSDRAQLHGRWSLPNWHRVQALRRQLEIHSHGSGRGLNPASSCDRSDRNRYPNRRAISGTLVPGFLTRKNETTVEIPRAAPSPPRDFSRRSQSNPSMVFRFSSICRFSARCFARTTTRSRKPNS